MHMEYNEDRNLSIHNTCGHPKKIVEQSESEGEPKQNCIFCYCISSPGSNAIFIHCSSIVHIRELIQNFTEVDADDEYDFDDEPMTAEGIEELDCSKKTTFAGE